MSITDILNSMRRGEEQSAESIGAFVRGVTDGSISRPQAAAWLAWAFQRGLTDDETIALTEAMTVSGDTMTWEDGAPLADKHSTGGVGDKVSLVLAPLWAELGWRVPMISGRGLSHTGGTLDKLESIPGYRTDLSEAELTEALADVGCFISGQTAELAPADRVLYALRNETCTVESIPFVVSSILSKKLAEGVQQLVLDVKIGSGSFNPDLAQGRRLARMLVEVARGNGVDCSARITEMGRPLGRAVGNALEVVEAIDCLRGGGPDDLREITLALTDHPDAAEVLASGRALDRFRRMVQQQGGDPRVVDDPHGVLQGSGCEVLRVEVPRDGHVQQVDARNVGVAAFELGAGRRRAEDPVDFGVGLIVHVQPGDEVEAGQTAFEVHHRDGHGLDIARERLADALMIGDAPADLRPLIHASI